MRLIIAAFCFVLCVGCGTKTEQVRDISGVGDRYYESQRLADEAFNELDSKTSNSDSPKPIEEKKKPIEEKKKPMTETKYPMIDGYPSWVMNPEIAGWKYLGVGSANQQAGGLTVQKRAATIQAQAEISRVIKVQVDNELSASKSADNKGNTSSDFQTFSRQRSNELLRSVEEVDRWTSPEGVFYLLLGIKE